uniref:B-cell receptor CD22 n=1 Tax=Dicentrarchus labrax TaxID=13489 RepID=A0A8C4GSP1_DICLA
MRGAVMSLTAAAGGFVVFLLSMPVVQGQKDWGVIYTSSSICASKGSTVDISCTYKYPSVKNPAAKVVVDKTMWFRVNSYETVDVRKDPEYSGRVQYICGNNDCTLRITDLRERDSAEYQFRFITNQTRGSYTGSPGVTLSVTGLQVQVIRSIVHQGYSWSELQCQGHCRLPDEMSYIWYKNGQKIHEGTSSYSDYTNPAESYSCALKGLEDFPSHSVCVRVQFCNRVTYLQKSICVLKGLTVDITCMYNSHQTIISKFWFSPEHSRQWQSPSQPEHLSESRVQVVERWRGRSTLRITDLRESDSGQYRFKFTAGSFEWNSTLPGTTLTVTDPDLQVVVRRSSYYTWAECHSSCHIPYHSSYTWFKNGQMIPGQGTSYSGNFYPADSYSCALKGREDFASPSVCVIDQSCNRVTYTNRSICASKGSSVDISCTYNSHKNITSKFWFSPERSRQWQSPSHHEDLSEDFQYADRVEVLETERGRSTLRITDLRESDSAQYRFKFTAGSFEWNSVLPGTTLTVTALQVQVSTKVVHESHTYAELQCYSSCGSAGRLSYVWFKNGAKNKEESSFYKDQFYPGDVISCALKGHETYGSPSVYVLRVPSVSVSPSGEIVEGSSVTLTCSSDGNPAATYTWYKRNGNQYLYPLSKEPQLFFRSIQSSDSGEYYCTAENELGRRTSDYISINVKYAPKTSSVSVRPSGEIVEGSSVTLTCSSDANPAATYTWYKENQTLFQGTEGIHHFTSISSEDRGIYHCKSENQHGQLGSKSVFIDVQYGPKPPSVSVSPSGEIVEGSSVNLTCSSDANPAANYTWYKENEDSIKASGQIFTITDFRPEHSGNYYCEAQNRRGRHNSTLHLIVVAAWKSTAAGTTTAVVLALILLSLFILFRKKWVSEQALKPEERPDNRDQTQLDDRQDDLHYASFQFSKNHTDPLYSNIGLAETLRHEEDEDEGVEYASVKFTSCSTALRDQTSARDDSDALYCTINKTCSAYQPGINIK